MRFSIDVGPQIQDHKGMKITVSLDTYKALTQLLEHEEDTYDAVIWRLLDNSNNWTPSQGRSPQGTQKVQTDEQRTKTHDTDRTDNATTPTMTSAKATTPDARKPSNDASTAKSTGTPPPASAAVSANAAAKPSSPAKTEAVKAETQPNGDENATHYFEYGVKLLIGTQLRRRYKGKEYVATVHAKGLNLDGQNYASLSEAAGAITEYEMNGWAFWQYQDPKNGKWEPVARLRKTTSNAE